MSKTTFALFSALAALGLVSSQGPIGGCPTLSPSPAITATSTDSSIAGFKLTAPTVLGQASGVPTLAATGFNGTWVFNDGTFGASYNECTAWWLNIGTSDTSVKPLTWNYNVQDTTNWAGGLGEVLTTTVVVQQTESPAASSNFLACNESGSWVLYLQDGTDVPAGKTCIATQLLEGSA
ncbi:hypothetical protein FRB94_000347 [Tulasnella sp. JGI-2019a]|nr:hypothetical protein FRB94_000347 [Tulasnella sp. JGI-2019a]